jgi:adenylosuccinate synthase
MVLDEMPSDCDDLSEVEPIYETLPGWARASADSATVVESHLPPAAKRYIERIQELIGIPASLVSVGPGRNETILRMNPFLPG